MNASAYNLCEDAPVVLARRNPHQEAPPDFHWCSVGVQAFAVSKAQVSSVVVAWRGLAMGQGAVLPALGRTKNGLLRWKRPVRRDFVLYPSCLGVTAG